MVFHRRCSHQRYQDHRRDGLGLEGVDGVDGVGDGVEGLAGRGEVFAGEGEGLVVLSYGCGSHFMCWIL